MEISLANKLGVSRTPIREAIRMLEHEGLVVMKPRRGAQVAKITVQELNDVLEVRKSLETLAILKACERMTEENIAAMRRAEKAFEALVADKDSDLTGINCSFTIVELYYHRHVVRIEMLIDWREDSRLIVHASKSHQAWSL